MPTFPSIVTPFLYRQQNYPLKKDLTIILVAYWTGNQIFLKGGLKTQHPKALPMGVFTGQDHSI